MGESFSSLITRFLLIPFPLLFEDLEARLKIMHSHLIFARIYLYLFGVILNGLAVPFLPLNGFIFPFVEKLSNFDLLGDDLKCGATYVPFFVV